MKTFAKVLVVVMVAVLIGCSSFPITPTPKITLEDALLLSADMYLWQHKDKAEGWYQVASNIIKMAEEKKTFLDIQSYLEAEVANANLPYSAVEAIQNIENDIISYVSIWPDQNVYNYIVDLAKGVMARADFYRR